MAAARFSLAAKTATESETLLPTPTNAGTRGAYYLLLPATSAICWRMGGSAAPNGVRILALVTWERKESWSSVRVSGHPTCRCESGVSHNLRSND